MFTKHGVFVAFEGGEGAGKSTQSKLLRDALEAEGYEVVLTFEPGDTRAGKKIRELLLSPETGDLDDKTEALLYAADRAEHVATLVRPALKRKAVVITDRYMDSSIAYQGAGRALLDEHVELLSRWATDGLRPHLTVVLDVEPSVGLGRFEERDRIEAAGLEFHQRVRQEFLDLAAKEPDRYLVIDARKPVDEIAAAVIGRVKPLLKQAVIGG